MIKCGWKNADDEILVRGNELTMFSSVTVLLVNSPGYFIAFRWKEVQIFFYSIIAG